MILTEMYKWATLTATRSWRAHAIISTSIIALAACIAWGYQQDALAVSWYAAIAMALLFRLKEIHDNIFHRAEGDWKKRKWLDHVTPEVDEKGDLLGAYTCLWLTTALMLARKLGVFLQAVL